MTISTENWQSLQVTEKELEEIYNYLLDTETPIDKYQITKILIAKAVINFEKQLATEAASAGKQYLPEKSFTTGEELVFPALQNSKGKVINVRAGNNPSYPDLQVIDVEFSPKVIKSFASNHQDHKLNNPLPQHANELLNPDYVMEKFGLALSAKVAEACSQTEDLVCFANHYFPRALLYDIGIGHLNLCEAVLEMAEGGPLSTSELISQIELPTGDNPQLTEFSINFALTKDGRFDEVGPSGIVLWFLKRLEPQEVQTPPLTLQFNRLLPNDFDDIPGLDELIRLVDDELESENTAEPVDEISISLSYPHWRAGTLPLTERNKNIFPTAFETPRVKFVFHDVNSNEKFPGWVVRPSKYVYGLRKWYEQQGVIPGSIITLRKSNVSGEVNILTSKSKSSRDWIRTVLVGADGGIVYAMLKQVIACKYDERMAIMITDVDGIDALWKEGKSRQTDEKVIMNTMRELVKLNPQNQIHAQELYSAVNIIKRMPPSVILSILHSQPWAKHLGDLYFKLEDN